MRDIAIEYSSSPSPIPRVIETASGGRVRIVERFNAAPDARIEVLADRPGLVAALESCLRHDCDLFVPAIEDAGSAEGLEGLWLFLSSRDRQVLTGPGATPFTPPTHEYGESTIAVAMALSVAKTARWPEVRERLAGEIEEYLKVRAHMLAELGCATRELEEAQRNGRSLDCLILNLQVLGHQYAEGRLMPALEGLTTETRLASCATVAKWMTERGFTQAQVATYLNHRGQRSRTGKPWTQALISHLLKGASR